MSSQEHRRRKAPAALLAMSLAVALVASALAHSMAGDGHATVPVNRTAEALSEHRDLLPPERSLP